MIGCVICSKLKKTYFKIIDVTYSRTKNTLVDFSNKLIKNVEKRGNIIIRK